MLLPALLGWKESCCFDVAVGAAVCRCVLWFYRGEVAVSLVGDSSPGRVVTPRMAGAWLGGREALRR
eukprot:7910970-Alexandrium_andersonii.AAC.1